MRRALFSYAVFMGGPNKSGHDAVQRRLDLNSAAPDVSLMPNARMSPHSYHADPAGPVIPDDRMQAS
jgi:hypothetical protein